MKINTKRQFHVFLIKPSKYDDEGYVIRWLSGVVTSNSLACLYALTKEVFGHGALNGVVEPVIRVFDESYQKVRVKNLCRRVRRSGGKALVCMAGVQTCQFERAVDLSLEFRKEGATCMIGGFHVSGCLNMLSVVPPEIQKAIDNGITIVAGEVENRWGELLTAAYEGRLNPMYNFIADKPDLAGMPGPVMPHEMTQQFFNRQGSFDAGRGCPFTCSFCTIINIQGHTVRFRTVDDIEKLVREQYASGVKNFFITDDNFSRHPRWEDIADRLIELKERDGIRLSLIIQVDTAAHKIPRFIEKMARAGVRRVFMGLESVNAENLSSVGKRHNQIMEYRQMFQKWRDHGVLTFAGYILGFPGDTYESIMTDVASLKRDFALDLAEFFIMTPMPGSKDHQKHYLDGTPMERDANAYDTAHVCMEHPRMTRERLEQAYRDAWQSFYSEEHLLTLLKRRKGPRRRILRNILIWFCSAVRLEKIHPLLSGFFRVKGRKNRRPGLPLEPWLPYYVRRGKENILYAAGLLKIIWMIMKFACEASRPENADYTDSAIS